MKDVLTCKEAKDYKHQDCGGKFSDSVGAGYGSSLGVAVADFP